MHTTERVVREMGKKAFGGYSECGRETERTLQPMEYDGAREAEKTLSYHLATVTWPNPYIRSSRFARRGGGGAEGPDR